MISSINIKDLFGDEYVKVIIAADAEPRTHRGEDGKIKEVISAGGVSVALDPVAAALSATYIARGKTEADKQVVDAKGRYTVSSKEGTYTLKRIFLSEKEHFEYYYGFSNQTVWPLCHTAFIMPEFNKQWHHTFTRVNELFAAAIEEEIEGKTFIWLNDYQLALVPQYLKKRKDVAIGMFWHIPWPTWEVFRILPNRRELLESLLQCDFLSFHRGYHVRNFVDTVRRELSVSVNEDTHTITYKNHTTTIRNLPMGVDTPVLQRIAQREKEGGFITKFVKDMLGVEKSADNLPQLFKHFQVMIGVDRMDYTKGIPFRLKAIDRFLEKNPQYQGKVVYFGVTAPSREPIPAYQELKQEVTNLAHQINEKYARGEWRPIHITYDIFPRPDVVAFYKESALCLVTPVDDGMNLVSKEFVVASASSKNPGMLILSQFAGSAIDLTHALVVNPYDIEEVADAIKEGLEMEKKEKKERIDRMMRVLAERNIYRWASDFIKNTMLAAS